MIDNAKWWHFTFIISRFILEHLVEWQVGMFDTFYSCKIYLKKTYSSIRHVNILPGSNLDNFWCVKGDNCFFCMINMPAQL